MAFDCMLCGKSFTRAEHLRRHWTSIHEQTRHFQCPLCHAVFGRADSLRRHQQIHRGDKAGDQEPVAGMSHAPERGCHACQPCALAKVKCNKASPCIRCTERQLDCVYVDAMTTEPASRSNSAVTSLLQSGRENASPEETISENAYADDAHANTSNARNASREHSPVVPSLSTGWTQAETTPDQPDGMETQLHGRHSEIAGTSKSKPNAPVIALSPQQVIDSQNAITGVNHLNWMPVDDDLDFSFLYGTGYQATPTIDWNQVLTSLEGAPSTQTETETTPNSELTEYARKRRRKRSPSLYVEGHGWRLSTQKAPKLASNPESNTIPDPEELAFPDPTAVALTSAVSIGDGVYSTLGQHFQRLCCTESILYRTFRRSVFPTAEKISSYVSLFLEHFDPQFPLLHRSVWNLESTPWISVVGAAAIGSTFEKGPTCWQSMNALREFLRRAISWSLECRENVDPLPVAQASVLHALLQSTADSASTLQQAIRLMNSALDWYKTTHTVYPYDQIDPSQQYLRWQSWIMQESNFRLLWFSWLCETQATFFRNPPKCASLPVDDLPLPSPAAPWIASTAEQWQSLHSTNQPMLTMQQALHSLYVEHEAPPGIDSLHQILLAYAVLSRTDEVRQWLRLPLRNWTPAPVPSDQSRAITKEKLQLSPGSDPIWLPANSQYASWRNSACDAFDNLHWLANRDAAANKGWEGASILHLHLARLLMLCPYHDFINLVHSLAKRGVQPVQGMPHATHLHPNIFKWLTLDHHKGRLSLVHAGAVIWYIRRYSLGQYYEPFAVYIAILSIWVYGMYFDQSRGFMSNVRKAGRVSQEEDHRRSPNREDTESTGPSSPDSGGNDNNLLPTTILLDRPCDDEIVQAFVRKGHGMRAEMSGAGDICTSSCQSRILEEGIKLLETCQQSGTEKSVEYRIVLQRLLHRTQNLY